MGRKNKYKLKKNKTVKKVWRPVNSSSTSNSPPPPSWIELPRDVTQNILRRLGTSEVLETARTVCTTWRSVCHDPSMWRVIELRSSDYPNDLEPLKMMCRQAVDLSQGQVTVISLNCVGDNDLLRYIAGRSSRLKRLTLTFASVYGISGEVLGEAVKSFPQLEELHLITMTGVYAKDVETIGINCPMLRSFSYNGWGNKRPSTGSSEDEDLSYREDINACVLAVAKSMPNLHRLQLFASSMTNVGLQAILDGCPHLETLDIRQCYCLDLVGDLGKRLSQQIKNVRRPSDSTDDYVWDCGNSYEGNRYSSDYSDVYFIGDYDDYTNPFSNEYLSDDDRFFFDYGDGLFFGHDFF